jgi:predicted nuclease of restriction endonuclease-like (RecB) superfamily
MTRKASSPRAVLVDRRAHQPQDHRSRWGDSVADRLVAQLARTQPGWRGFTRRNLFRMRQFYEAYQPNEFVTALLAQIPWTHHLIIRGQSKSLDEREFYLRLGRAG